MNAVKFYHGLDCALQPKLKRAELFQFQGSIPGLQGVIATDFKLRIGFLLTARFFVESIESRMPFRGLSFPKIDESLLEFAVRAITRVAGDGDGVIVFSAGAEVISHERGGVAETVV